MVLAPELWVFEKNLRLHIALRTMIINTYIFYSKSIRERRPLPRRFRSGSATRIRPDPDSGDFQDLLGISLSRRTSVIKRSVFFQRFESNCGKMAYNAIFYWEKILDLQLDANDLINLIRFSLSTNTFLVKFSRRSDQSFSREVARQTDRQTNR